MPNVDTEIESEVGFICEQHGWCPHAVAHVLAVVRAHTVMEHAFDSNQRGINFQPGQTWTAIHSPRRRARRRTSS